MSELAGARFQQLVEIMRTLRSEHGCAWDRQQTLKTLRPFVLQETYELLDALDRDDHQALEHELGDFLFEAVFLAQICEEEGRFSIADSIKAIADKLVRRHPHIFDADGKASLTPKQVKEQWEEIKAKERTDAGEPEKTVLSGVPRSMPSLLRAYELSTRAAMVGFDWVKTGDVIDKAEEEIRELREAVAEQGQTSPGSRGGVWRPVVLAGQRRTEAGHRAGSGVTRRERQIPTAIRRPRATGQGGRAQSA